MLRHPMAQAFFDRRQSVRALFQRSPESRATRLQRRRGRMSSIAKKNRRHVGGQRDGKGMQLENKQGERREELAALLQRRGWGATLRRTPPAALTGVPEPTVTAGVITELVPAPAGCSLRPGVTSLAVHLMAQSNHGEGARKIAWCDPLDRWDPAAVERAGVELERILWLRGCPNITGLAGLGRWNEVLLTLLASGSLELIVADFLDWPLAELQRIPRSAWFRLLRAAERWRRTALVVLAPEPITQSCAALVLGVKAETGSEIEADSRETTALRETTPLEVRISAHVLRSRAVGDHVRKPPQAETRPRGWRLRA